MATNNTENQPQAVADNGAEAMAKAKNHKKTIVTVSIIVAVLLVATLAVLLIRRSGAQAADDAAAKADIALMTGGPAADSIALPLYLKAADKGYESGNRARIMAGVILYNKGEYKKALEQFEDATVKGDIAEPGLYIARGNCYANLNQLDKAADCFEEAADKAEGNAAIAPYALVKLANVYHVQKKYADEAECYEEILKDYPQYAANPYVEDLRSNPDPAAVNYNDGAGREIQRYYERAKALAGKK